MTSLLGLNRRRATWLGLAVVLVCLGGYLTFFGFSTSCFDFPGYRAAMTDQSEKQIGGAQMEADASVPAIDKDTAKYESERSTLMRTLLTDADYYTCQRDRYARIWLIGSLLVILMGAVTSVLIALDVASKSITARGIVTALPIFTTLVSGAIGQYAVSDTWQLHEEARLRTLKLHEATKYLSVNPAAVAKMVPEGDQAADGQQVSFVRRRLHELRLERILIQDQYRTQYFERLAQQREKPKDENKPD